MNLPSEDWSLFGPLCGHDLRTQREGAISGLRASPTPSMDAWPRQDGRLSCDYLPEVAREAILRQHRRCWRTGQDPARPEAMPRTRPSQGPVCPARRQGLRGPVDSAQLTDKAVEDWLNSARTFPRTSSVPRTRHLAYLL